ncbi:MAG: phosphoribosylformylglycinamidine cyclo-ligase [Gemmatimonadales bacterium]
MTEARRYRDSGVDLQAAEAARQRIARAVESTRSDIARGPVGGFGGMIAVPRGLVAPNLVMSTDGVGSKVLVAIMAGVHHTIGQDLVNHCVNDVLVHGARPLAFQDYIAAHTLETDTVASLVDGVALACRAHETVLTGGETAQLPDLYRPGHYDLAGTILGIVGEESAIQGNDVALGDQVIAFPSNGLHTNGYTLARRVVFDDMGLDIGSPFPTGSTVAEELLRVHRSYFRDVAPRLGAIKGLAHITGGGIPGNLPRTVRGTLGVKIDTGSWEIPELFCVIRDAGRITTEEMFEVFNMGVGLVAVVGPREVDAFLADTAGVGSWLLGEVVAEAGVRLG